MRTGTVAHVRKTEKKKGNGVADILHWSCVSAMAVGISPGHMSGLTGHCVCLVWLWICPLVMYVWLDIACVCHGCGHFFWSCMSGLTGHCVCLLWLWIFSLVTCLGSKESGNVPYKGQTQFLSAQLSKSWPQDSMSLYYHCISVYITAQQTCLYMFCSIVPHVQYYT